MTVGSGAATAAAAAETRAASRAANSRSATSSSGASRRRRPELTSSAAAAAATGAVTATPASSSSSSAAAGKAGVKGVGGGVCEREEAIKAESDELEPIDLTADVEEVAVVVVGSENVDLTASWVSSLPVLETGSSVSKVKTGSDAAEAVSAAVVSAAVVDAVSADAEADSVSALAAALAATSEVDSPLKEILRAKSFTSCIMSELSSPAHTLAAGVCRKGGDKISRWGRF